MKCVTFVSDTFTRYGRNIKMWQKILTPTTLAFSGEVVHEKLWKSVNICKSYGEKISGTFLCGHGVICFFHTTREGKRFHWLILPLQIPLPPPVLAAISGCSVESMESYKLSEHAAIKPNTGAIHARDVPEHLAFLLDLVHLGSPVHLDCPATSRHLLITLNKIWDQR